MKRSLLVLLLGLVCGVAAHFGWFYARRPPAVGDLNAQLAWMKTDLNLTDEQVAKIKAVHEASAARLVALASQVAGMREEWTAFERQRQTSGRVDFLEFARFVEQRRALDHECAESTRRLVTASAGLMNAQQRQRYFDLLGPALKEGPPRSRGG